MKRLLSFLWAPLLVLLVTPAFGQIWVPIQRGPGDVPVPVPLPRPIIMPTPGPAPVSQASYKIESLEINGHIRDQVSEVSVSQKFVNTGSQQMEVVFVFPLPPDAAIDGLTFMVDGTEYQGEIMASAEARGIYESYMRRNQDPALLEWMDHGMFKTSVFPVPAGATRQVTLSYTQILDKDATLTDFIFPMSTAKYSSAAVEKVSVRLAIDSAHSITSVYSPTHEITVERPGTNQAVVTYEATNQVPTNDFRLMFDTASNGLSASVISYRPNGSDEGYFILLASPELQDAEVERPAKTVIFVVDRSGSMSGKKIEQAREALKFVINNLHEGDLFNIVAYDTRVESFAPELMRFNDETRQGAIGFANGIYAGGGTNIDGALTTALDMLKDDNQPSYIVFLTDGRPTEGETNEIQIVANSEQNNGVRARLISLGVGYDVNSRLLERLTQVNFGQDEFVRPDEDIEAHVSKVFERISSPVLSEVSVDFGFEGLAVEDGSPISRQYPERVYDLFEGDQMVLVGRYKRSGEAAITITGTVGGEEQTFNFPANFVESSNDTSYDFVAKLWAMRRIGSIVDEIDMTGNRSEELLQELVGLSTTYGILTPYTSYLADDQPDMPQRVVDFGIAVPTTADSFGALEQAEGEGGFAQRDANNRLQRAASAGAAPQGDGSGVGGSRGFGGATVQEADRDETRSVDDTVRSVGNEAMYRRGNVWIASSAADVDLVEDAAEIVTIERFSDEYFELVEANTQSENDILATQQPEQELVIRLRGTVYRIQ